VRCQAECACSALIKITHFRPAAAFLIRTAC
jgi:hypothetical protein